MTTRKKTPADVVTLKQLVNEQALQIASLTKERDEALKNKEVWYNNHNSEQQRHNALKKEIEEVHTLIDTFPGALPREMTIEPKNNYSFKETKENSLMLRLASFLGAASKG